MGKIVSNLFISLDGVVEAPDQWHFPYFNDEMGAIIGAGMESTGAFLMGRKLYSEWSEYWPPQPDDVPFSTYINGVKKYVLSNSLSEVGWNNSELVTGDDVAGHVRAIKQQVDGDITMSGSASTALWLLGEGLLDEFHLLLHPIAVGHGRRLFEDGATHPLRLVHQGALSTGVLDLVYTPAD